MEAMTVLRPSCASLQEWFCVLFFPRLLSAAIGPGKSNSVLQLLLCHARPVHSRVVRFRRNIIGVPCFSSNGRHLVHEIKRAFSRSFLKCLYNF